MGAQSAAATSGAAISGIAWRRADGYAYATASDGAVFPYVFTLPATYWAQADAMIKYVGDQMGGLDKLKGKKIGSTWRVTRAALDEYLKA